MRLTEYLQSFITEVKMPMDNVYVFAQRARKLGYTLERTGAGGHTIRALTTNGKLVGMLTQPPISDGEGTGYLILESAGITESDEFKNLKKNKIALTPEEREEVLDKKAVWHQSYNGNETAAVWKSVNKNGKTTYITNTHRAYLARPTLKGAISAYHSSIKDTA